MHTHTRARTLLVEVEHHCMHILYILCRHLRPTLIQGAKAIFRYVKRNNYMYRLSFIMHANDKEHSINSFIELCSTHEHTDAHTQTDMSDMIILYIYTYIQHIETEIHMPNFKCKARKKN